MRKDYIGILFHDLIFLTEFNNEYKSQISLKVYSEYKSISSTAPMSYKIFDEVA